jgi:hypothetical protein
LLLLTLILQVLAGNLSCLLLLLLHLHLQHGLRCLQEGACHDRWWRARADWLCQASEHLLILEAPQRTPQGHALQRQQLLLPLQLRLHLQGKEVAEVIHGSPPQLQARHP